MIYYRSEMDAKKLIRGRMGKFKDLCRKGKDLSKISDFVMEKHVMDPHDDLRQLGMLERVFPDGIRVVQIADRAMKKFRVEPRLLDDMAENGIAVDALKEGNHVVLYGRLQQGMIVEAVALNLHSLPEPNEL